MARKNLIEISAPNPERMDAVAPRDNRPIAGFVPQERSAAPVGGITKTLGNITEKMERASELERQLAAGQTIVELDPRLIDASFVSDRLAIDAAELAQLVEQIREHGQQVPILVRPHPETGDAIRLPTAIDVWLPPEKSASGCARSSAISPTVSWSSAVDRKTALEPISPTSSARSLHRGLRNAALAAMSLWRLSAWTRRRCREC